MKKTAAYETHVQSGILLNANEKAEGLPEEIVREIADAMSGIAFHRYPDNDETELLNAYAKVCRISPAQLLAGNGSDQILGYLIGTYLGKVKTLYTFDPDFSMYDYYASGYEADVKKYVIEEDGSLDIDGFIEEGKKISADLVMFSNPNNPSGHCLSLAEIERIVTAFSPVNVVVDEAYIEFAEEESAACLLERYDNLFVTRTLSKAYGLAGVRVGFLLGPEGKMIELKNNFVPYTLNCVSMKIASIVLRHADETEAYIKEVKRLRQSVYNSVKDMKRITFWNSQTNFLYAKTDDKQELLERFEKEGITIRDYKGSDKLRITIGTEKENELVLKVLKEFEEKL